MFRGRKDEVFHGVQHEPFFHSLSLEISIPGTPKPIRESWCSLIALQLTWPVSSTFYSRKTPPHSWSSLVFVLTHLRTEREKAIRQEISHYTN